MIKASAGGGGKGMRIAWNDEETRYQLLLIMTSRGARLSALLPPLFFLLLTLLVLSQGRVQVLIPGGSIQLWR